MIFDFNDQFDTSEVQEILCYVPFEEKGLDIDDFTANGYRTYDEDGNSEWIGFIEVDTNGKTQEQIDEIEVILYIAQEEFLQSSLCGSLVDF